MRDKNSYQIQNFAANVEDEIKRLKAQVDLFWEKEYRCLRMFGLRDGMKILECGCGPGHVIEKLLQSLPRSEVTGVEIDGFLVEKAKDKIAALGVDRGHIFEQSIMQMDFADNSFDFAISRMVLEHLADPLAAVKEVYRVLKTGGKAVFIDNDFDLHLRAYPEIPELSELYRAYCTCRIAEGGRPKIGRELPVILQEGGFSNVDLEVVSAHSRLIGDKAFLKSEGSGIPAKLVKDGYLSRGVLDRLARNWHDALQQEQHALFRQLFVAVGEKLPFDEGQPKSYSQEKGQDKPPPRVDKIPSAGSAEENRMLLTAYLQVQVAALLETKQERIPVDDSLIFLGVNSFISVELANRVAMDFGITISPVDILEAESILAIATRLHAEIDKRTRLGFVSGPEPEAQWTECGGASHVSENTVSAASEDNWEEGEI